MFTFGAPILLELLNEEDRKLLAIAGQRRSYHDGEVVHERGEHGFHMGVVIEGTVELYRLRIDGKVVFATSVVAGQNYGDTTSASASSRTHRAISRGTTKIDHYTEAQLAQIMDERPSVTRALYHVAAFRLSTALEIFDDIRVLPTNVRVAKMILRMLKSSPILGEVQCRQEELAQILGLSMVSVAHNLKLLAADNLIETGYRRILVHDVSRLERWVHATDWE